MKIERPEMLFPAAEAEALRAAYEGARVILEYGSGGSTLMAAEMPGKFIVSVESDKAWAVKLQLVIDDADLPSPATVWPVDVGATGDWGRPRDNEAWTRFHRYALAVWDEPFFRHPDVILIDGRFRPACLMTACLRAEAPVTVYFDDYAERPRYHGVETVIKPTRLIGRMAEFHVTPDAIPKDAITAVIASFAQASYAVAETGTP